MLLPAIAVDTEANSTRTRTTSQWAPGSALHHFPSCIPSAATFFFCDAEMQPIGGSELSPRFCDLNHFTAVGVAE